MSAQLDKTKETAKDKKGNAGSCQSPDIEKGYC